MLVAVTVAAVLLAIERFLPSSPRHDSATAPVD